jgi:alpha-L-rhamnosidase
MNSFNHYAYGAIGEWLYSTVAGLEIDETRPGYKHALIRPRPGGGLTYANASLATGYGRLASHWQLTDKAFTLHVNIPVNTSATVILPVPDVSDVLEGERPLATGNGIKSIQSVEENTLIEVGSGEYVFVVGFTAV